ncbi:MAG: energy transducer TonB, partial [Myxococcota bacterium]
SSITRRERRLRARELRRERRRAEREAEEKVEEEPAELEVLEAPEVVEPETPLPPPPPPVLEIEPEKLPPVKQAPRTLMARRVAGNQPTYPRRELERGIEDTVRVNIALDRDGKLIRYELLSGRSAFQRAVRDVVENWEFKPHVVRGQRVETRGIIEIEFKVD